jgi:hypothetical protein
VSESERNDFMPGDAYLIGEEWVAEEWHRPVGVICAGSAGSRVFPEVFDPSENPVLLLLSDQRRRE